VDTADFSLSVVEDSQTVCTGDPAAYVVEVGSSGGFTNPVTLATSGLPGGAGSTFSPNPVTPGSASSLSVTTGGLAAGTYAFDVDGSAAGSAGHDVDAQLVVVSAVAAPTLSEPANGATGVGLAPTLTWNAVTGADSYRVEIATDAAFTNLVASQDGLATTSWTAPALAADTVYYWRVRATNACGNGAYSPPFTFTTGSLVCRAPGIAIPDGSPSGVDDTLSFSDARILEGMRLHVVADHTWVGDLKVTLSRDGQDVVAIDRPGVPGSTFGCGNEDIDVVLDDAATSPVEDRCNSTPPAIDGVASPNNALDVAFAGMTFGGAWNLNVSDAVSQDSGSLVRWCLEPKFAPMPTTFTVGGDVDALVGSGLVLSLNGTENLPIAEDGPFTFATELADGASYAVAVATQPHDPSQSCAVVNGEGTIGDSDVTDVEVHCTTNAYTVGGTVGGLLGDGLVLSLNGGAQTLPIDSNGSFAFPDALPSGTSYAVTVASQPTDPSQSCAIANGNGTVDDGNVTDITVTCSTHAYSIGGTVGGLLGDGLVLSLHGGAQTLPIDANGSFTFPDALPSGTSYVVTVATPPSDPIQACTVANGSGTIDDADVSDIVVSCTDRIFADGFEN
jgi:subtilisin-like proprotein convertase family protein